MGFVYLSAFRLPLLSLQSEKGKQKIKDCINLLFQIAESLPWAYIIWIFEFDISYIIVGTIDPMLYLKHENPNVTCKVIFLNPSSHFGGSHNIYHGFYDLT